MRKKAMKSWEKRVMMRPAGWMLFWFLAGMAIAGNPGASAGGEKLSLTGTLEFDAGEFLKARTSGYGGNSEPREPLTVDHIWFGHAISTLNLLSKPNDFFAVRSSFEFRQYSTMLPLTPGARRDPYFGTTYWNAFFIREGQGIFSLFKGESTTAELAFGYMPYKYNPDVQNLGEFMFRSGTYPLFLINEFERPFARLLGLRAGASRVGCVYTADMDILGFFGHDIRPFNDLSLAAVGGITFLKAVSLGAGVDLANLVPVNSTITSLEESGNMYTFDTVISSIRYDSLNQIYDTARTWDTGYYTYRGTKLMARASLDIRGLLPFFGIRPGDGSFVSDLLGVAGGKIYGEYAIIGLENYPASAVNKRGYTDITERSPWMLGCTAPCWKIFDVCAFEIERFPSYFPDNYGRIAINCYPLPVKPIGDVYDSTVYKPRWNWSLYLKKQVTGHFGMVLKVGRDHQRWEFHPAQYNYYDFEAAMVKPDQWGWQAATVFSF